MGRFRGPVARTGRPGRPERRQAPMGFKRFLGLVTLANQLTFLRLIAMPFFVLAVLHARFDVALGLFVGAAITDLLDGLTARMLRQRTPLGAYLDPAADKLLMTAAFILLTDYPAMFQGIPMIARLPVWFTILAISRDVFIVLVALLMYLAYGHTRFEPTSWGKLTTIAELITLGLFLLANALGSRFVVLEAAVWLTLVLILVSGFDYLRRAARTVREEGPGDAHVG